MSALLTIAPVFLLIVLGAVLRRTRGFSGEFFRECSRLAYWVGLPCELFVSIATSPLRESWRPSLVGAMLAASAFGLLLAVLSRRVCPDPFSRPAFIMSSIRGNLVFVGLPVLTFACAGRPDADLILARTALMFAVMVPVYNLTAVLLLHHGHGSNEPGGAARALLTNPLILACVAGIVFSLAGLRLPEFAVRTFRAAGGMAMPLALLAIGSGMDLALLRRHGTPTRVAAAIKVAAHPLAGMAIVRALGLESGDRLIVLVCLACPTAVASYVLCDQMGADRDLAAGAIVWSTLLSVVSLTAAVAFAV
jgi:hypothetical protein